VPWSPTLGGHADLETETFARRLATMPGCQKPVRRGRTFVLPYTPFAFACLADELVASTPHVDVYEILQQNDDSTILRTPAPAGGS